MIQFKPINNNAKHYPKTLVPVLPILSCSSTSLKNNKKTESPFIRHGIFFSNARSALANALMLSKVNQNCAVLMPAYHCGSMIEPALWLKADVLLYQLNKKLRPNTSHIEQLICNSEKPITAMLLPHYFGFLQDTNKWRSFCDQHNIILIEDCAHAFFGQLPDNTSVGTIGDFAIASVRKFFCTPDGGILIGKKIKTKDFSLHKTSLTIQLRSTLSFIQQSFHYDRLNTLGAFYSFFDPIKSLLKSSATHKLNLNAKPVEPQWKWFASTQVNTRGNSVSQWLMKHSNLNKICDNRRKNYLSLLNGIKCIQHVEPLFQTLPENTIPYMLPVLLKSGEKDFDSLKRTGMPIWRWEELAESSCTTSQNYRLQLLHLPCHQELKESEINWILNTLEQTLGKKR